MNGTCSVCGTPASDPLLDGLCPRCLATATFPTRENSTARRIGEYELLGELGRGGMGVVYLARQVALDRLVALKLLVGADQASPETRARFEREAREAARLRHPHIVAILDVGTHDGAPYYSMDLIEGDDLDARYSRRSPTPRAAARLVMLAARAVHHAHEAGVLHRDIKPGNILIDEAGDPHLTDFGLARAIDGRGHLTQAGEVLGSPAYAAPEQLRGEASILCDVYALGAVLYFLLTRRPPFVATQLPALLAAVERGDPVPPRRLDPSLPRDLETIALRALAREPASRYPGADALADDLEHWLEGRPIAARPASPVERAWRWSLRNRALAAAVALLGVTLVAGSISVTWQWRRAEHAAAHTTAQLYASELKVASDALLAGDLGTARRALARCPPAHRDAAWRMLSPLTAGDARLVAAGPEWTVTDLAISQDGRRIAAAAQDDLVRIWNMETGVEELALPGTRDSWSVGFSPDDRSLFTGGAAVTQWNLADTTIVRTYPGRTAVLSPDGRILYTCAGERFVFRPGAGPVAAWRTSDGAQLFEAPLAARLLAVSPDGRRLAVSDATSWITILDAADGHAQVGPWDPVERVWHLEFSPDGQWIVASGWSREVRAWHVERTAHPPVRLEHPLNTWQTAFSPDGAHLAVACSDQAVHLWETTNWTKTHERRAHENEVWSLAWRPDGRLVGAGRDPRLLQWDRTMPPAPIELRHDEPSTNIAWLPGARLATSITDADGNQATVITDVRTGRVEQRFPGESPLAFDPQTGRLWSWAWAGRGGLRARRIGAPDDVVSVPWILPEDDAIVGNPRVVPSAGIAWAAMRDGALELRRLADGTRLERHADIFVDRPALAAALSPDGRWFAWTREFRSAYILDRATGARTRLDGHHYDIVAIAFAPDGRSFVTGGHDGLVFAWSTARPHRSQELWRLRTSVGQLTISADNRVIIAQEPDVGVRLWNRATAREVAFLPDRETGADQWGAYSLDDDWFAMRRADGLVRLWPMAPAQPGP